MRDSFIAHWFARRHGTWWVFLCTTLALLGYSTALSGQVVAPGVYRLSRAELDSWSQTGLGQGRQQMGAWRFKLGDDPRWAAADFDDHDWGLIDPRRNGREVFPLRDAARAREASGTPGIYWFRLRVRVDSNAAGPAHFRVDNFSPIEVYLNGTLIEKRGEPNALSNRAPVTNDLAFIPLVLPAGESVVAMRINVAAAFDGFLPGSIGYVSFFSRTAMEREMLSRDRMQLVNGITSGLLLALGALHLFLCLTLPRAGAHGWFAAFALGFAISVWAGNEPLVTQNARAGALLQQVGIQSAVVSFLMFAVLIHRAFSFGLPRAFSATALAFVVLAILSQHQWRPAWFERLPEAMPFAFLLVILGFGLVAIARAVRNRLPGAWLFVFGGLVFSAPWMVTFLATVIGVDSVFTGSGASLLPAWLLQSSWISLPVAISIYLARDVGASNRRLLELSSHLEEEVAERTAELREARALADEANQAKSQFLATMSHELRTPLNAIIGYSEMLTEEAQDAGDTHYLPDLERIQGSGRHLLGLINDILDLSKIEAGRMELYVERFDAASLFTDVATTMRPLLAKNDNRLALEIAPDIGIVHSDQVKLRQTLLNLLSNAGKFTSNGTISLRARREVAGGTPAMLAIEVSDTGIGMTADQVSRLFQPFTQAEASTTRRFGGTGLGLAITRRLVELMQGTITVQSTPKEGTTFTVRVPAELVASPVPAPATAPVGNAAMAHKGTVLVIDDEPNSRDMLTRVLQKDGYRVISAANGREGLERAQADRPDVITLDIMMQGMDGWSVLSQLKADGATADIPVVIVSIIDDRNLGLTLGAADHVGKPIDREQFTTVIRRLAASHAGGP